ncbi:hypothetical protein ABZP36_032745 [Zizania latifolia]
MSVMQQLNFVSLLLLLSLMFAALSPFVATAYRELPMARNGGEEETEDHGQAKLDRAVDVVSAVSTWRSGAAGKVSKKGRASCSFRTRKLPADAKTQFDDHTPFTADYVSVHRHPPKHN